jgi:hypothetical protein
MTYRAEQCQIGRAADKKGAECTIGAVRYDC